MKILWKEWQQQKWLFLIGCLAGISFPVLECLLIYRRSGEFRTDMGSAVVLVCGALFAIIMAIATTHHDTRKGVDDFWQSKPVKPWRLYVTKIVLAAVLLSIAFLWTISLDLITHFRRSYMASFAWEAFCYTYLISLMLFAVTMFLVVVLRDTAKAVLFAIWAGLLVYFVPLLVGGLKWMNIFEQMMESTRDNSIVANIIVPLFKSWFADTGSGHIGLRSVAVPVRTSTLSQAVWRIVSSPEYLEYLLFVAVAIAVSIVCVILSVVAFKRNWRWQARQKTIVWTIGLSAAFIFGVAMTQVGHNLEPIKEWNGKKIVDPAVFDWSYMYDEFHKDLPEGQFLTFQHRYFNKHGDAVCLKDDLMFRVSCGYQWKYKQKVPKWEDEVIRHFVVQIYCFPYAENSKTDLGPKRLPDLAVGAMRLFSTEPLPRRSSQQILGCFAEGNYLYIAYRPQIRENKEQRIGLKKMPIYFATIDITNPEKPKLIGNIEIDPTMNFARGFANYGDYCYLSDGGQLVIISVAQAGKPEIVRKIPYVVDGNKCGTVKDEKDDYCFDLGDDPGFPSHSFSVVGDKLLCNSHTRVAILDLVKPTKPKVIYNESFVKQQFSEDERIQATAYKDNYIYISTNNGLYIRKLVKQADGKFLSELVGKRIATPIEKLAGRKPLELLFHKDYLIEASSGFGLMVYNVSNPENPERLYHAATQTIASDIGIWNNLLFMQTYGFKVHFFDIPETK